MFAMHQSLEAAAGSFSGPALEVISLSSISATEGAGTWESGMEEPARGLAEGNLFTLWLQDGTWEQVEVCAVAVTERVGLRKCKSSTKPETLLSMRGQLLQPTPLRQSASHNSSPRTTDRCTPPCSPPPPARVCRHGGVICKPAAIGRWLSASARGCAAARWAATCTSFRQGRSPRTDDQRPGDIDIGHGRRQGAAR